MSGFPKSARGYGGYPVLESCEAGPGFIFDPPLVITGTWLNKALDRLDHFNDRLLRGTATECVLRGRA